ncbi:MAG: hypothetical protein A3I66_21130 [Burkholderiales bacterium RIFCSPLOWO2_02_FULL_57_36]|nr:MAG: hypothetical protein A3I66_21130 [Burkholderiales bacterium RIFCSPLOWO2_02_FULL_57_36]
MKNELTYSQLIEATMGMPGAILHPAPMGSLAGNLANGDSPEPEDLQAMQVKLAAAMRKIAVLRMKNVQIRKQLAQAREHEAAALASACMDELTGLPNRRLLKDRLQQLIAHATRQRRQVAVLLIDLDGFKSVNDTLGHAAGDQLLRAVAQRLTACLRAEDTACRYGGDEFVVVLPELGSAEAATTAINKVRACLQAPYVISGREMPVTASIGCALYPGDGQAYHELIDQADTEMYRAKARRRMQ